MPIPHALLISALLQNEAIPPRNEDVASAAQSTGSRKRPRLPITAVPAALFVAGAGAMVLLNQPLPPFASGP